jgi:hypothetical protein
VTPPPPFHPWLSPHSTDKLLCCYLPVKKSSHFRYELRPAFHFSFPLQVFLEYYCKGIPSPIQAGSISGISASGVGRHRFDADPDPNFHVDVDPDPDPDPDWHQNDADPHADPSLSVTHVGKCDFFLLFVAALQVYNVLPVTSVSKMSNFKYLRQLLEILWKKY